MRKDGAGNSVATAVEALEAKSHRGLWPLVAFLSLSIWARSGFRYIPPIPENWKSFMGAPPPPALINALFVLYLLSALILSLMRMADEIEPTSSFRHLGYLAAFYGFHFVAGSLPDNYFAVLIGGVVLLTFEYYRAFQYNKQKIQELIQR